MGASLNKSFEAIFKKKEEYKILILGFDGSGKTSLVHRLKFSETAATIPTLGFNLESFKYKNLTLTTWDMGGQESIRELWKHYYQTDMNAVIFVIDSTDRERLEGARQKIDEILQEKNLLQAAFLILANKQDLPNTMHVHEISNFLNLKEEKKNNRFKIQACSATTGEGLSEGFDWLAKQLKKKKK